MRIIRWRAPIAIRRVNRIFEGTNEINRMLIIQMLMKRAMTGALPLMQRAPNCSEEILGGPSFESRLRPVGRGRAHRSPA
jgi:hypothetical protein